MCYYDVIYCESCLFMLRYPPVLCDKITSGVICSIDCNIESRKTMNGELYLYDILPAREVWIDSSVCSCGEDLNNLMSYIDTDNSSDTSSTDDSSIYYNSWPSMGDGHWDDNCGSPQWIPM